MKKIIVIILVAGVGVAAYFKLRNGTEFLYAGTIEATEVDVSSRLFSMIAEMKAQEGDSVSEGEVLARLDCSDIRLSADVAEKDFSRASSLFSEGSMAKEAYDRLKYKRDDAVLKLDWCAIKSPLKGRVLYRYREPGEVVSPGTRLLTLADLGRLWAYVYVPHDLVVKLSVGMKVEGTLAEMPGRVFAGEISVINSEAEFTPKNVQTSQERTRLVYGVKIIFPNADGVLKPGMSVEVKLPE